MENSYRSTKHKATQKHGECGGIGAREIQYGVECSHYGSLNGIECPRAPLRNPPTSLFFLFPLPLVSFRNRHGIFIFIFNLHASETLIGPRLADSIPQNAEGSANNTHALRSTGVMVMVGVPVIPHRHPISYPSWPDTMIG